jgi:hypothetical protein
MKYVYWVEANYTCRNLMELREVGSNQFVMWCENREDAKLSLLAIARHYGYELIPEKLEILL